MTGPPPEAWSCHSQHAREPDRVTNRPGYRQRPGSDPGRRPGHHHAPRVDPGRPDDPGSEGSEPTDIWGCRRRSRVGSSSTGLKVSCPPSASERLLIVGHSLREAVGSALMIPSTDILITVTSRDVIGRAQGSGVISGAAGSGLGPDSPR